jgi:hypothetical protein
MTANDEEVKKAEAKVTEKFQRLWPDFMHRMAT